MPLSDPGPPPRPDHIKARARELQARPSRQERAGEHLETAEAAILSWSRALEEDGENAPSVTHILFTVLSHTSRAAGLLEED